ncbi:MAG TPA: glycosyltransferase [Candidatus Limiplasma sp.]|nr:glycosyltransferase [Candidatus Limiplasma sp.]
MSKRVLLISHCFAPQNKIGAVRPTKLAKYLTRMGYQVTVLCGKDYSPVTDPLLARDLEQIPDVHRIVENSLLRRWKERKQPVAGNEKQTVISSSTTKPKPWINALYLFLADRADAAFARACKREIMRMGKRFDVVLSTYGPLSVHSVANYAKRKGYAKRWIADFRDETAMPFAWQKSRLQRYNRMVANHADQITAVSAGYLRVMGWEERGCVIYNGFDPEDMRGFSAPVKRTDKLAFIHCGQMYGAQRDLSPFFKALAALMDQGMIGKDSVALVYAGKDTSGFVSQAIKAGLETCLEGHGFMPRDESLRLQQSSHVLLLPAWNLEKRQGNIPGKLLEYMMLDMPVVCCVSGNMPDSEIAGIIRKSNIGICWEQANSQADTPRLKAYLEQVIRTFQKGEPAVFDPNREAVAGFTCEGMARKMANTIEDWT